MHITIMTSEKSKLSIMEANAQQAGLFLRRNFFQATLEYKFRRYKIGATKE